MDRNFEQIRSLIYQNADKAKEKNPNFNNLTNQEIRVLMLYSLGYSYKDSSNILNISLDTTKTHLKNISNKMDCSSSELRLIFFLKMFF